MNRSQVKPNMLDAFSVAYRQLWSDVLLSTNQLILFQFLLSTARVARVQPLAYNRGEASGGYSSLHYLS